MIVRVEVAGLYTLNKLDETSMPRMWNTMYLKKYYLDLFYLELIISRSQVYL